MKIDNEPEEIIFKVDTETAIVKSFLSKIDKIHPIKVAPDESLIVRISGHNIEGREEYERVRDAFKVISERVFVVVAEPNEFELSVVKTESL